MSKRIVPVLALSALLPAALAAQSADERIEAALARAQNANIPVELIQGKVAEGQAKGVAADRLAFAVERRTNALLRAQTAMSRGGQSMSADDLSAGADALGSGVSEAILETIANTAPQDRRAVAITALTQLVQMEVVPEEALERVIEALARGPEALASLPGKAGHRGPPAGVGPAGGVPTGPPAAVPAPGQRPGSTNPMGPGKPGRPGG
jgi:hypothetical protein